jgi:hypothetical protein
MNYNYSSAREFQLPWIDIEPVVADNSLPPLCDIKQSLTKPGCEWRQLCEMIDAVR